MQIACAGGTEALGLQDSDVIVMQIACAGGTEA
jgi:hypothetical protein